MSRCTLYSISCLYMRIIMIVYSCFVNKVILPCKYILAWWYIFFIYELECKTKEISNGALKLYVLINGLIQIQIMVTISNLLRFIVRIPSLIKKLRCWYKRHCLFYLKQRIMWYWWGKILKYMTPFVIIWFQMFVSALYIRTTP